MKTFPTLRSPHGFRRTLCLLIFALTFLAAACRDSVTGPKEDRVRLGSWGGAAAGLEVTETGATAKFSCGRGIISQPLILDREDRFDVPATHFIEIGPASISHPARYTGRADGNRMTLTVMLLDTGQVFGPFNLVFGRTFNGPVCA